MIKEGWDAGAFFDKNTVDSKQADIEKLDTLQRNNEKKAMLKGDAVALRFLLVLF